MTCPKFLLSINKRIYRLRNKPLVVKRLGASWLLDPKNWIDNRLLARAPYETLQLREALELIHKHQLTYFIDIGANIGLYSVLLGKNPQIEKVLSFEPMRRNFAQLQANLFLNNLQNKVEANRCALGSENATVDLHVDPQSTGLARIDLAGAERDASVFTHSEKIEIVRFDEHHTIQGRRVFIKIDTEGHAASVLDGMREFFSKNHVVSIVELSSIEEQPVREFFQQIGHKLGSRIDNDQIFLPIQ